MQSIRFRIRSSFFGLMTSLQPQAPVAGIHNRTEDIRACMLAALGTAGTARFPFLARRIGNAPDPSGLWYLRSPLMEALSALNGEQRSREHIAGLSSLFEGLLPAGLASRPSPLEHDLHPDT